MEKQARKPYIFRRITSLMMSVVVAATCISFIPVAASAEEVDLLSGVIDDTDGKFYAEEVNGAVSNEWDGSVASSFDGGTGTESDPYRIATAEQLALLAKNVDNGTNYNGLHFALTADILLNDDVDNVPQKWNSIGEQSSSLYFAGTLDGANHKVIGLYQNGSSAHGLFAWNCGTVKDISVTDGRIVAGNDYVGGICGRNFGIMSNCYNAVNITGSTVHDQFGGVCGYNAGIIAKCRNNGELYITGGTSSNYKESIGGVCGYTAGTISNSCNTGRVYSTSSYVRFLGGMCGTNYGIISECYNTGEVNGYRYTGGMCGYNWAGTIKDSYNSGEITGRYQYLGGVCGYSGSDDASDDILRCHNTGDIINTNTTNESGYTGGVCGYLGGYLIRLCYNTGSVTTNGTYHTAGVCGRVEKGEIKECYNSGPVTASYNTTGGVAGYLKSNCVVENCYNTGAIKGRAYVGGVWGASNDSSTNTMKNCYNAGTVSGTSSHIRPVGENEGQITNVYYNTDICADTDGTNSNWAKTTGQMTASTVLSDLGFDTTKWSKTTNSSKYLYYPNLKNIDGDQPRIIVSIPATNVKVSAGDGKVTLTWNAVEDATKYAVYKYENSTYTCVSSSVTGTSFNVTGLTNGTKYGFKVKAYVDGKWSGTSAMVYATPVGNIIPENLRIANGNGKVQVTWDKVSGATKYAVYSYLNGKYTTETTSATTNTYTVTGLTNGTKYGFKVKAYVNGKWSAASAIIYARPSASTAPGAIKATAGNGSAEVKWSGVIGATKYAVYKYENGVYTCINSNIKDTTFTVTGLTNGTKYGFKVKAYVDGKWSAASVIAYATPTV